MAGRILIAEDQITHRLSMRVTLAAARYQVAVVDDLDALLPALRREQPDLLILDTRLGEDGGAALCRGLADTRARRQTAVLLIGDLDAAERCAALKAGADDILARPCSDVALMARVRNLMRLRETQAEAERRHKTAASLGFGEAPAAFDSLGRTAIVTDETALGERWMRATGADTQGKARPLNRDGALDLAQSAGPPDAFIIDAELRAAGGGLALLSDLRSRAGTRHSAMLFAYSDDDDVTGATALDFGANDIMPRSAAAGEVAIRLTTQLARKREADHLRDTVEDGLRLAATDPLTGLFNRRYALSHLTRIAEESTASAQPFAVMIADLDHFKAINDRHGHAAGDRVLRTVARRIRDRLRGADLVARLGGEEFLILMPHTDLARARPAAERLCRIIAETRVETDTSILPLGVTASIGVAVSHPGAPETPAALIDRADRALYRAKNDGRNKIDIGSEAA